jgi:hypothetical protein
MMSEKTVVVDHVAVKGRWSVVTMTASERLLCGNGCLGRYGKGVAYLGKKARVQTLERGSSGRFGFLFG